VKSILNKLSADNFKTLVVKLEQCGLKTSAELEILVQAVFDVAAAQRSESGIYADLCAHLVSAVPRYCFILRRMLREQCLLRFEKLLNFCDAGDASVASPKVLGQEDSEEEYEEERRRTRRRAPMCLLPGDVAAILAMKDEALGEQELLHGTWVARVCV